MLSQQIPPSLCCGLVQAQRHLPGPEEGALCVTAFLAEILCTDTIYRQNCTFSTLTSPMGSGFPAAMQWFQECFIYCWKLLLFLQAGAPYTQPLCSSYLITKEDICDITYFTIPEQNIPNRQKPVELSLRWGHLPAELSQSRLMPHHTSLQRSCG